MYLFLGVFLLVYGGMHLYAGSRLWHAIPHTPVSLALLGLAGVALTLTPFLPWLLGRMGWHGAGVVASWIAYLWMGYLLLFCLLGLSLDLAATLSSWLGFKIAPARLVAATVLLALAATAYGYLDARDIRVERIAIKSPKVSTPVTIAQVSDMHLGAMLGAVFIARVGEKISDLRPDMIVATGDIVDGQADHLNGLSTKLRAWPATLGKYAVLGNHEYFVGMEESLRFMRDAGFTMLRGDAVDAGPLVVAGVDDLMGLRQGKETHLDAGPALKSLPADRYVILLKHQPLLDPDERYDLQLSGHIHGGQFFPFGIVTKLIYKVDSGLTQTGPQRWLYVSRGTGTWGPPLRILAPPEVTLITLEPEKSAGIDVSKTTEQTPHGTVTMPIKPN